MRPYGNNISNNTMPHQNLNPPNNYTFDLKVNVDFNSRQVNLKVPNQPFNKKDSIPIMYPQQQQPLHNVYYQQHPFQRNNHHFIHQYTAQNQVIPQAQVTYRTIQRSPSHTVYDGTNTKGRTSLNTTVYMAQEKLPPVECVICQKFISQQNFSVHLQQHRNRKRLESFKEHNTIQNSSEVSIRNKNQTIQYIDNVKNSRFYTQKSVPSNQPIQLNLTNSSVSMSSNHSNGLINPYPSHQFRANPTDYSQRPIEISNHIIRQRNGDSSLHLSQSSSSSQNITFINYPPAANGTNRTQSLTYSSNPLIQHNDQSIRLINHNRSRHLQGNIISDNPSFNNIKLHRIQSLILRRGQQNRQVQGFDKIGESVISRNSVQSQTTFSQLQKMNNHLKYHSHNDSVSSSNSDDSLFVNPSKIYRTVQKSEGMTVGKSIKKKVDRSTYTQKPSKSKLPTNFLAVQQFLINSTSSSNFQYKCQKLNSNNN